MDSLQPRSPVKPLLITPSVSPPPTRSSSQPFRQSDTAPPPLKRQRTASARRRSVHDPASSSNSKQTPISDVGKEREASRVRLLGVWSSLAQRYSRHMDEDDLVDITTGEIIRDNGVLRNAPTLKFGSLADPSDEGTDEGTEAEDEDEGDEYDLDELDAFAEPRSPSLDRNEFEDGGKVVPPVTLLDPTDVKDLHDFLEEEKRRREQCGSDADEDSDQESLVIEELLEENVSSCGEMQHLVKEVSNQVHDLKGEGEIEKNSKPEGVKGKGGPQYAATRTDYLEVVELSSEDELDNWTLDESNAIRVVKNDSSVIDSDIEILEPPVVPHASRSQIQTEALRVTAGTSHQNSVNHQKTSRQLHTPPRSQSFSYPSSSPISEHGGKRQAKSTRSTIILDHCSPTKPLRKEEHPRIDSLEDDRSISTQKQKLRSTKSGRPQGCGSSTPGSADNGRVVQCSEGRLPQSKSKRPFVLLTPRKVPKSSAPSPTVFKVDKKGIACLPLENPSPVPSPSRREGKGKERDDSCNSPKTLLGDSTSVGKRKDNSREENLATFEEKSASTSNSPSNPKNFRISRKDNAFPASNRKFLLDSHDCFVDSSPEHSLKRKRASIDSIDTVVVEKATSNQLNSNRHNSATNPSSSSSSACVRTYHGDHPSLKSHAKESQSDSCDPDSSSSEQRTRRRKSRSRSRALPPAPNYGYPHVPYTSPHCREQTPQGFAPIPDPRAQFIIAHAMQQLSALVSGSWHSPHYLQNGAPHTPSRRGQSMQPASHLYSTPTRPGYSYVYNPSFSHASMPPESPECDSSPERLSGSRRKSLVHRSRSRGRRVSFRDDEEYYLPGMTSSRHFDDSPSKKVSTNAGRPVLLQEGDSDFFSEKGQESPGRQYVRGQTPGPKPLPKRRT